MWSGRRSAMTTFMPAARKALVMPSPIPLAPPVTNAVLPSTSTSVARPGGEGALLSRAAPVLDREPVGRHGLVGERADDLVEDPAQLIPVVRMREHVEAVVADRAH